MGLYFFDQYGCGSDSNPPSKATFELTVNHATCFIESINNKGKNIGLLGHSMGAAICLNLLDRLEETVHELVFLNPIPPTKRLWEQTMPERKISPQDKKEIDRLSKSKKKEDGLKIIHIFTKYDVMNYPSKIPIHYKSFNLKLCEQVQSSMGNYDFRHTLKKVPKKSILLTGEKDFIRPEVLKDYKSAFPFSYEIRNTKHFPFNERPDFFLKVMESFLCE